MYFNYELIIFSKLGSLKKSMQDLKSFSRASISIVSENKLHRCGALIMFFDMSSVFSKSTIYSYDSISTVFISSNSTYFFCEKSPRKGNKISFKIRNPNLLIYLLKRLRSVNLLPCPFRKAFLSAIRAFASFLKYFLDLPVNSI